MIYLKRGLAPDFWTRDQVKKWTRRWIAKECRSKKWYWPEVEGKKLNDHAREGMPWQHNKCAFCEAALGKAEIEHFRAETNYPLAAFVWRNLFLICNTCNNAKGEKSHEGCLKPDREDPADYLWVHPRSLEIEPKPNIDPEARERARKTIEVYDLNRPELTTLYEIHLELVAGREDMQTLTNHNYPFSLMMQCILK